MQKKKKQGLLTSFQKALKCGRKRLYNAFVEGVIPTFIYFFVISLTPQLRKCFKRVARRTLLEGLDTKYTLPPFRMIIYEYLCKKLRKIFKQIEVECILKM